MFVLHYIATPTLKILDQESEMFLAETRGHPVGFLVSMLVVLLRAASSLICASSASAFKSNLHLRL